MGIKIIGTGSYLPPKELSNDALPAALETNDEWIFSHTGIHSRHIAGPEDCTSVMAVKAAREALAAAGVKAEELAAVILATGSPDYHVFPSTACVVQHALGCTSECAAWDISAACTGFIYALEQARGFLTLHPARPVLVVGAETLSRVVDWNDRGSCILFGDGAGAAVVAAAPDNGPGWVTQLGADGGGAGHIFRDGGTRFYPGSEEEKNARTVLQMNGKAVYSFAVRTFTEVTQNVCKEAGVEPADVDLIFAHQANRRIIEGAAKRMGLPMEKYYMTIENTGNTSAASIPLALDLAVRKGELKPGMRVVLVGFGSGLTFGGTTFVWPGA